MVEEIQCDLFAAPINILLHACNTNPNGIWGGLAGQVKKKFPEAYKKELEAKKRELGKGLIVRVSEQNYPQVKYVVNLYTQPEISNEFRMTDYEAVARGLEWTRNKITNKNLVLGIPRFLGSDKGGGSWQVIRAMIEDVYAESTLNVLICGLPGSETKIMKSRPFNFV